MVMVLSAVAPVFMVIAFGMLLRIFDVLREETSAIIGAYVLKVALPVLCLHLLAASSPADLTRWNFWIALLGPQLALYFAGYAVERMFCRRGRAAAAIAGMNCSLGNAAFVGLPIILALLPGNREAGVIAGLAVFSANIINIVGQVSLDILKGGNFFRKGESRLTGILRMLRVVVLGNPILMATLTGICLAAGGWGLWHPLDRVAQLVGYTAAPCMLLALGLEMRQKIVLAAKNTHWQAVARQMWYLTAKLVLNPLLCWAAMVALGVQGLWLSIGVVMSGTATALVVSVMAEIYRAIPEECVLTIVLSHVLNIVTLTILLWCLHSFGLI